MTCPDKEMSCCSFQYCSIKNHSKTQWLWTTVCCFLLQFCGLTRISCIILTWHFWWSCHQRVARAGVKRRSTGLAIQEDCFPHLSVLHHPPHSIEESRAEDHGVAWTSYTEAQGLKTRKQSYRCLNVWLKASTTSLSSDSIILNCYKPTQHGGGEK